MAKNRTHQVKKNHKRKDVISGEELRKRTKSRQQLSFSVGRHMTEKDRPRKKKWDVDD